MAGKMKIMTLFVFLIYLSIGCGNKEENCHKTISFKNIIDKELIVVWETDYPDTVSFAHSGGTILNEKYRIQPNEINDNALRYRSCWEDHIESRFTPSDTIMIFVFDAELLKNTPWREIYEKYQILRRYDLSLSDLQILNWEVSYPPTAMMKTMKMYPPYGVESKD